MKVLPVKIFVLTTRGLESVVRDELERIPGMQITAHAYRCLRAQFSGDLHELLKIRCADDVFFELAEWHAVSHVREMLAAFQERAAALALDSALQNCRSLRAISDSPLLSVSVSFVGKRNYSSDEVKSAIAVGIKSFKYTDDDRRADLNLRLFITHDEALVGLRVGKNPLHERLYKTAQIPGSLKPSIAAAMLRLAEPLPKMKLVDPCCGAGTILAEADAIGIAAQGGDLSIEALEAARENSGVKITPWDARQLPLGSNSIERVVSNLPWGRQVEVDSELAATYAALSTEIERILALHGRVVLLTIHPELLSFHSLSLVAKLEISLFGQQPTIVIYDKI